MLRLGLCSSALIARSPGEIVAAAAAAGLDAIEWSSETFSSGDGPEAAAILMDTLRAGLTVASYSSLFRAGGGADSLLRFRWVLESARALHAPNLRIFAGTSPGDLKDPGRRSALLRELRLLGDEAGTHGVTLCLSCAKGTGIGDHASALSLAAEADHPFVRLAWEPLRDVGGAESGATLEDAGGRAALLVVKRLGRDGAAEPLAGEGAEWGRRLAAFRAAEPDPKMGRFVLIGSVARSGDGDESSLASDADFLRSLARGL